jgi:hypothetical protein
MDLSGVLISGGPAQIFDWGYSDPQPSSSVSNMTIHPDGYPPEEGLTDGYVALSPIWGGFPLRNSIIAGITRSAFNVGCIDNEPQWQDPLDVAYTDISLEEGAWLFDWAFSLCNWWGYVTSEPMPELAPRPGIQYVDPGFISATLNGNPFDDDLCLRPDSPLIDAGDPAAAMNDLDGTRNDLGAFGGPHALTCDEVRDRDGDTWFPKTGDCDDSDAAIYPFAPGEIAGDGVDTDCDGLDDPRPEEATPGVTPEATPEPGELPDVVAGCGCGGEGGGAALLFGVMALGGLWPRPSLRRGVRDDPPPRQCDA